MEFNFTFLGITAAIFKLFILAFTGYLLYAFKHIDDKFIDTLSKLLVRIIFPALIISKTTEHFSFSEYRYWWFFPVCAAVFSIAGMLLGYVISGFLRGFRSRKEFMCVCGFQNCGYLPMNLILFAFSGAVADKLLVFMFLFILAFNLLMWSLVPLFLAGRLIKDFKLSLLLTPPVIATIFALLWVAFMGKGTMPSLIRDPMLQLGQAAFPVAMIVLGGYLCRYRAYAPGNRGAVILGVIAKVIVFPAIVLFVLIRVPIGPDHSFFLFLQAVMPTAVSLVVVGSYTNSDNEFMSGVILYSHLAAILTIPVWLTVFKMFT